MSSHHHCHLRILQSSCPHATTAEQLGITQAENAELQQGVEPLRHILALPHLTILHLLPILSSCGAMMWALLSLLVLWT